MLFLLFTMKNVIAQAPPVLWQQTVSSYKVTDLNNSYNVLNDIIETRDGSYAGVGSNTSMTDSIYFFKLARNGSLVFKKYLPHNFSRHNILETTDGGYMVAGSIRGDKVTNVPFGSIFGRLMKLDKDGNVLWEKFYRGGNRYEDESVETGAFFSSFAATSDGGYVMGYSCGGDAGRDKKQPSLGLYNEYDYWLVKVDGEGAIQWEKTVGGIKEDLLQFVIQTEDGGYVAGGSSSSSASGNKTDGNFGDNDFWIVKMDNKGNVVWDKTIGGNSTDQFAFIRQTKDKGYFLGGTSRSPVSGNKTEPYKGGTSVLARGDYWVLKLSPSGVIEWQKAIGGSGFDDLKAGFQDKDGGYLIGGISSSPISGDKTIAPLGKDYWIVKLATTGDVQWQTTAAASSIDELSCLYPTQNGAFIAAGSSWSPASGNKTAPLLNAQDFWIVKYGASQDSVTICPGTGYKFNGNELKTKGTFQSTYRNIYGLDSLAEITIDFYPKSIPALKVEKNVLSSINSYENYQWLLNDAAIAGESAKNYTASKPGLYRLAVVDENQCRDTSSIYRPVFETNLFVPNVFTPNGDGKNDVLKVYGNQLSAARLLIFNQWGQKIYESNDAVNTGWNGQANGKPQPTGVYIYTLHATLDDGTELKRQGSFSLIR